jgi:Holliday junction resolvase RusA-like endonuclease
VITFKVDGQPVPQGSMKVINGHVIHAKGSELAVWRSSIALRAKEAGAKPHLEPVEIDMIFTMARPKTVNRPRAISSP